MTPRHPPRALGGLTTPTRPPRRPKARRPRLADATDPTRSKPPVCAAARGVVRRCGPPIPLTVGRRESPPRQGGFPSPHAFVERLFLATTTQTLELRDACVTDDRIVKD